MTQQGAVGGNPERAGPITMEDLAGLAGVSISTVSRALRGHDGVRPATRARIEELARVHRFQPNQAAARLRRGRSQTVAVAVPALNSWYFADVIAGAQQILGAAGFDTLVAVVASQEAMSRLLDDASPQSGRVDGVIVVDMRIPDDQVYKVVGTGTTLVSIGRKMDSFPSVMIDDVEVGRMATRHLIGLGHREIGIVKGLSLSPYRFDVPDRRRSGYLEALAAAGIEAHPEFEAAGNYNMLGGAEAARLLLTLEHPPTALFCMSDFMAFGALRAARDLGLRVPHDVSIIGVDGHEAAPTLGLTTIEQDPSAIGTRAAQLLLDRLEGTSEIRRDILPVRLAVRHTTRSR